jgi:hypothetical protein
MFHRFPPRAAMLCAALASFPLAHAAVYDRTAGGAAFIEGGVGEEEESVLMAEESAYALTVRTVARRSGAYLADVHLRILDAAGRVVFERQLQAPWLLIDLPPGRYEIEGVHDAEVRRQAVSLVPRAHRHVVLYFPVDGETVPHRDDDDD